MEAKVKSHVYPSNGLTVVRKFVASSCLAEIIRKFHASPKGCIMSLRRKLCLPRVALVNTKSASLLLDWKIKKSSNLFVTIRKISLITNCVDWRSPTLGTIYVWSELQLCSKIIKEFDVSTANTIFASFDMWWDPVHCHSQHFAFVWCMGLITHDVRKEWFRISKHCGVFHEVGYYNNTKILGRNIHLKECMKTPSSSTYQVPYQHFKF